VDIESKESYKMVLGKKGMQLEAWKFVVYITIPVVASVYFNDPKKQQYWADYFQFLKYPASPNTNLKEQFDEMVEQKEKQKKQRNEYAEQMRKLQESAQKSRQRREELLLEENDPNKKQGWMRWLGLRKE
jgi:septal ring factor EnvC (AmiA/AmiB activator)